MAKHIQKSIVSSLGTVNRGVKERTNLGVLKNTKMPAVLIETAFIDNFSDGILLKTKQDEFAKAIFDGICNYAGIKPKEEKQMLASANDIIWELSQKIQINDTNKAVKELEQAQSENSSLYWILYKIANN